MASNMSLAEERNRSALTTEATENMQPSLFGGKNRMALTTETSESTEESRVSNNGPSILSYASVTGQEQLPTREQAIVLKSMEGLTVQDYAMSIGNIIEPVNITDISRISQGRVCLYLKSKEIAEHLIENVKTVCVANHTLEIRSLVTRAKRILISNVEPIVPNDLITKELCSKGVRLTTNITHVEAAMSDPNFAHIKSFRRQVYVDPEDVQKIPKSMRVKCGGYSSWIYFSAEQITCFICNQEGHLARYCQNAGTSTITPDDVNNTQRTVDPISRDMSNIDQVNSSNTQNLIVENSQATADTSSADEKFDQVPPAATDGRQDHVLKHSEVNLMPPPVSKRALSKSNSQTSVISGSSKRSTKEKNTVKRARTAVSTSTLEEMQSLMQPAYTHLIENQSRYPVNAENLTAFLHEVKNGKSVITSARKYTEDLTALNDMLGEVYRLISSSGLRRRITRIKKRLSNADVSDYVTSDDQSSTGDIEDMSDTDMNAE
ncbi:hypothetical protein QAD02_001248 [Eretmocerus hayati]|uniref:Uncharacterized protein n=1 Tax=Eretmocerus hayati TaxID=131215 RepID=A0ACC2NFX2_9HYME|nr:hypothetical protein QAD02_001248 [Eretmocerus hayati]